jgi:hypothetical protein
MVLLILVVSLNNFEYVLYLILKRQKIKEKVSLVLEFCLLEVLIEDFIFY